MRKDAKIDINNIPSLPVFIDHTIPTNFCYGDEVEVTVGFYKGMTGKIIRPLRDKDNYVIYEVELMLNELATTIQYKENYLKKKLHFKFLWFGKRK